MNENKSIKNAIISGAGSIGEGEYNNVVISGSGKALGNITAKSVKVSGAGKFEGSIESETIAVSGSASFLKMVKTDTITCSGATRFADDVEANKIRISGVIKSEGTVNAEEFIADCGDSIMNEICGERVEIKSKRDKMKISQIEATTISIRNVACERVSGDNIVIGSTCLINIVEYRNSLTIGKGAKINKIIKL